MTRVGVTGATGYIGGALVPFLANAGFDVCPVDDGSGAVRVESSRWPVRARDLASAEGLRVLADCDVVLHLGAVSGVMACADDPVGTARVNVAGTRTLVAACAARRVPVAFASSLAVVGAPQQLPVTEETPARPTHEYARQKAAGEAILTEFSSSAGISGAVLRMSNVYGTYLSEGRAVAKGNVLQLFSRQAAEGRLTVNAPGTQRRDFIHLEDALAHWAAAVRFLRSSPGQTGAATFNVASGESCSVLEIADKVVRGWAALHPGSPAVRVDLVPNPRQGVELIDPEFAVSRAETERRLGVSCHHTVDDSLNELLALAARGVGAPAH